MLRYFIPNNNLFALQNSTNYLQLAQWSIYGVVEWLKLRPWFA